MPGSEIANQFLGPAIAALVAWLTARGTLALEREKLRREYELPDQTKAVILRLLRDKRFVQRKRSFREISNRLRGFSDENELRRELIRAGAVAFSGKEIDGNREELWGLVELTEKDVFHD